MANVRIRKVETEKQQEQLVDDYITMGYRVVERGNAIKVKKTEYGGLGAHLLIALITAWWTFFIGNILYLIYKYTSAEEVLIRVEPSEGE